MNNSPEKHLSIWHGGKDLISNPKWSEWYHKKVKNSHLYYLETQGHISLDVDYFEQILLDIVKNLEN